MIDGWFSDSEAALYLRYLAGRWLEIGAWRGRSARVLAATGHPGVVVEWFQGSPEHDKEREQVDTIEHDLRRNLEGFDVEIVGKDFRECAAEIVGPFQFLHLDADHSYDMTEQAFNLYTPKLRSGGFLALHDAWGEQGSHEHSAWAGSMQFAKELIRSRSWMHVEDAHRAAIFEKR